MASEHSDTDTSGEWTILHKENENLTLSEQQRETDSHSKSGGCLHTEQGVSEQEGDGNSQHAKECTQSPGVAALAKIHEIEETGGTDTPLIISCSSEAILPDEESSLSSRASHVSSDIDVIDDDGDGTVASLDSSDHSHMSSFSFLSQQTGEVSNRSSSLSRDGIEVIQEDLSDASCLSSFKDELPSEIELKPGLRRYVHHPNRQLNVALNVLVVTALAAVVGLGIGNFLGWSSHWGHQKQMTQIQVMKLKQLQDELLLCMEQQRKTLSGQQPKGNSVESIVCYENTDYWKQKFEKLFQENHGLHELLENAQHRMRAEGSVSSESFQQCSQEDGSDDDFHKLKLDLIVKQMEHLQLLKTFEEIKYQEKQSRERLKELEEENLELRAKLEEEESEDQVMVELEKEVQQLKEENVELKAMLVEEEEDDKEQFASLQNKIQVLEEENKELNLALQQLQTQVGSDDQRESEVVRSKDDIPTNGDKADATASRFRLDALRQKINQMIAENDDLKGIIARLRYGKPAKLVPHDPPTETIEVVDEDPTEPVRKKPREASLLAALQEKLQLLQDTMQLEKNEAQKWKLKYEAMWETLNSKRTENGNIYVTLGKHNWSSILEEVMLNGTQALHDFASSIVHYIGQQNLSLKDEIGDQLNATHTVLKDIYNNISAKLEELQNLSKASTVSKYIEPIKKTAVKISDALKNTYRKLQDASTKFMKTSKPHEASTNKLVNKVWKIVDGLENRWFNIRNKLLRKVPDENNRQGRRASAKVKSEASWYFNRANDRKQHHGKGDDNRNEQDAQQSDWYLQRARDREQQRQTDGEEKSDWFLKRGQGRKNNRRFHQNTEYQRSSDNNDDYESKEGLCEKKHKKSKDHGDNGTYQQRWVDLDNVDKKKKAFSGSHIYPNEHFNPHWAFSDVEEGKNIYPGSV